MHIMAVDDEQYALMALEQVIRAAYPGNELACFMLPSEALAHARAHRVDVAFLDIEMGAVSGLSFAKSLKDIHGKTNIIFTTGHSQYALPAYALSPSGYLLKPITTEALVYEMDNLRHPLTEDVSPVYIQTFGHFEVFAGGKPLPFARAKSKELLAYLVDRKGAAIARKEIAATLWEDQPYTRSMQTHLQILISSLMQTLREAGAGDILIRQHGRYAIDTTKVRCDYYDFCQGDARAVNAYCGEYMANYSWAEFTEGMLSKKK